MSIWDLPNGRVPGAELLFRHRLCFEPVNGGTVDFLVGSSTRPS